MDWKKKAPNTLMLAVLLTGPAWAADKTVYTEKMLRKIFETKEEITFHQIMERQRKRLREMQDAFLVGHAASIEASAADMVSDMSEMPKALPPGRDRTAAWRAMSTIVSEAGLLKEEMAAKNYRAAYEHYSNTLGQCVRCHQATRYWGKFEEPAPGAQAA